MFVSNCAYISYNQVIPLARNAILGVEKIKVDENLIESTEYSFARVNLGRAASVIMILEKIDSNNNYDFVINRAVSSADNLIKLCNGRINYNGENKIKNGIICLKGGNLDFELKNINEFQIIKLKSFFSEQFFETKKILYIPNPYNHMDS